MAKAKRAAKQKHTPKSPPQSLGDAVVLATMAEVNTDDLMIYASGCMGGPQKLTEGQRKKFTRAVLKFAAIGFAFYTHYQDRTRQARS